MAADQNEEKKINRQINAELERDRLKDEALIKLLLLGPGESGKSTVLKQMLRLYTTEFEQKQKMLSYKPMIWNNTISSAKVLLEQLDKFATEDAKYALTSAQAQEAKTVVLATADDAPMTAALAGHLGLLWQQQEVRLAYDRRSEFQLIDACSYFLDNVTRLAEAEYVPTASDVLFCRVKTTGIVEHNLTIDRSEFLIVDVGGQRNERRKWIHCFENVTAMIFVADVGGYDKTMVEDNTTNRLHDALQLFEDTVDLKWFHKTSIILFLNKIDQLREKLTKVSLRKCFPDYPGNDTYEEALDYIQQLFAGRTQRNNLYVHPTWATDTDSVRVVFGAVKDTIIKQHLHDVGMMM